MIMMTIIMVTEMFTGYQKKDNQSTIQHILTTTVMDIGDMMSGTDLDTVTDMIVIILPTLMRKMKTSISSTICMVSTMEIIMETTTETMEITILRIITIFIIMVIMMNGSITRKSTHMISSITDLLQSTLRVSTILITIIME